MAWGRVASAGKGWRRWEGCCGVLGTESEAGAEVCKVCAEVAPGCKHTDFWKIQSRCRAAKPRSIRVQLNYLLTACSYRRDVRWKRLP